MKYIIDGKLGLLSKFVSLEEPEKNEWYGHYNEEGGYYSNVQLLNHDEAQEIAMAYNAYMIEVKEATVIVPV